MTVNADKIKEAIATLERARDEAIEKLADGDITYISHLEKAVKGLDILNGLL